MKAGIKGGRVKRLQFRQPNEISFKILQDKYRLQIGINHSVNIKNHSSSKRYDFVQLLVFQNFQVKYLNKDYQVCQRDRVCFRHIVKKRQFNFLINSNSFRRSHVLSPFNKVAYQLFALICYVLYLTEFLLQ